MKLIKFGFYLILTLVLLSASVPVRAEGVDGTKGKVLSKTTGTPATTKFNINNISTFFTNDGASDLSVTGDSGFQFPIGSGKTVFYESGFLYGGYINGEWRVSGSTYNRGQLAGRIITPGTASAPLGVAESPTGAAVRIYRVRRDYKDPQADYSKEIMDEGKTKDAIYQQYDKDWQEWPAQYGAPYEDKNGNGTYEPAVDVPGVPGADQTIWFVCNDVDPTQAQKLYGSLGLGIEMQATIWGYNQQNALGDALFRKYTMINKGFNQVDSCYVNMWSDPDLGGDAGDDFAGCDTVLSLGFIYNGDDQDPSYGRYIPSAGFDFMQGPILKGTASQKAVFKGKYRNGYYNMPMTAFYLFTQGVANYGDPTLGSYANGALRVRNLMQGKVGTLGTKFVDPLTGKTTKFFCPGDPVTGKGWVDGILFPKQDRRMGAVSGPFTLAVGDTQEVVVGQLAAGGVAPIGRLGAVALLKFQDAQVQRAYDNLFVVPQAPKAPIVALDPVTKIGKASELDKKLIISWGEDQNSISQIESYNQLGYKFEGYVVYQLPRLNAQLNEAKIVATFDLPTDPAMVLSATFDPTTNSVTKSPTKFGTNSGIQRSITIDKDYIRGGVPLANGTEYYYVVSSYVVHSDPDAVPNVLETLSARIAATPHSPNPGVVLNANAGDVITATHSKGASDGKVLAAVYDPTAVTGHNYEVSFATVSGKTVWNLKDLTTGTTKLSNQSNQNGDANSPLVDGLQVKVSGAPNDFKDFIVTANAGGKLATPAMGTFAFNANGFPLYNGLDRPAAGQMKNSSALWGIATGMTSPTMDPSYAYFLTRVPRSGANWPRIIPYDFEIRFTAAGSKALMAFSTGSIVQVPFELWNTGIGTPNVTTDDYKLVAFVYDVDGNDQWNLLKEDHTVSGGDDDPDTDWIYFYDVTDHTPGTKGYDAAIASNFDEGNTTTVGNEIMARISLVSWNGGSVSAANFPANQKALQPETGSIFRIETTKPNQPGTTGDVFTFTAPSVSTDLNAAKKDVDQINVFPNPYYGSNPREVNKYQRYVTFSHLPQRATLRVFNLAGQLVRILQKDSPSQFTTWDLVNDSSFPVASGLYIVHIDMPDLGQTKILKLAIIQEQQILDHF